MLSKHFDFSSIKNLFKAHSNYIATETIFLSQPSTHCLCTLGICGILQFFHCAHCELVCLKIKHLYGPKFLNTKRFTVFEDKIEIYFSLFLSFRDFFVDESKFIRYKLGRFDQYLPIIVAYFPLKMKVLHSSVQITPETKLASICCFIKNTMRIGHNVQKNKSCGFEPRCNHLMLCVLSIINLHCLTQINCNRLTLGVNL